MSARKTRCITWGETRRTGSPLVDADGRRVGMIDFEEYVTLCGREHEDPEAGCAIDHNRPRPRGICVPCFSIFQLESHRALYPELDLDEVSVRRRRKKA